MGKFICFLIVKCFGTDWSNGLTISFNLNMTWNKLTQSPETVCGSALNQKYENQQRLKRPACLNETLHSVKMYLTN